MTTRAPAVSALPAASVLALAAFASACETGGSPGAASGNTEASAEAKGATTSSNAAVTTTKTKAAAKAEVAAGKAAQADSTGRQLEQRTVPGQAQLDLAAAQLAEANARLNNLAGVGAAVSANAQPGSAKLEAGKAGAVVDAKVQPGNPSLNVGKAGTLIDANVQAGKPSLNIGGLKAVKASTSAGSQ
jgi:hypothetical protein